MTASTAMWLNGAMIDPAAAVVSVADHGLTVGDGAFETMRTEGLVPFAIGRHLARLHRSLDRLGLELPWTDDQLRDALGEVASAVGGPGRIRLTVTGGPGPFGSGRGDGIPTVFVVGTPATPWTATGSCVTVPWRRNEHSAVAGVKSTSYAENVVALAAATAAGAGEALFANTAGDLCEGTGSNVFVVIDGMVLTPPLSAGCLAGITRELILEVHDVEERPLSMEVLATADEVFLTSSTRDVQGQHRVDDRTLAAPGPVTATVAAAFAALVAADLDP